MKPRGLYVVNPEKLYSYDEFTIYAKLSTIHDAVNDKLIEKAKKVALECQLTAFAVVDVGADSKIRILYRHE